MSAKGLTREVIVSEAVACMEHTGQPTVSLHELARRLGVKTPSLYNHIQNTRQLQRGNPLSSASTTKIRSVRNSMSCTQALSGGRQITMTCAWTAEDWALSPVWI